MALSSSCFWLSFQVLATLLRQKTYTSVASYIPKKWVGQQKNLFLFIYFFLTGEKKSQPWTQVSIDKLVQ